MLRIVVLKNTENPSEVVADLECKNFEEVPQTLEKNGYKENPFVLYQKIQDGRATEYKELGAYML